MSAPETYDIVIAGGGTCGCIVASRLADADPSLSILVVEAGPPTRNDPLHTQPCRYLYHLRPESTTVKFHVGRPSDALAGRSPIVPCGQCLGGGSSVNFTMYSRAAASDFDDWANVHGNHGWSAADLLPLLQKCETYEIEPGKSTHGYSGPLKVSWGGFYTEIGQEFLKVGAEYDKNRGATDDINGLFECNKYGRWQKWISKEDGVRSDIPHNYLYNKDRPNIHILTGNHVKRVLFDGTRATGIEYVPNKRFHPDKEPTSTIALAKRLVVISAGTFGSPGILERSGIGQNEVLEVVNVKPLVDLRGVGEHYQDHQVIFAPYLAAPDIHTLDALVTDDKAEVDKWTEEWQSKGTGLVAHNGLDSGVKLRPFKKDLDFIGDAFRERWLKYYVPRPDKPVLWLGSVALYLGDRSKTPIDKAFCVGWYIQHPASMGRLHITSGTEADAPLDFHPGFCDDPQDMALHKWGYKLSREFARRMPSYRGEVVRDHPVFSRSSKLFAQLQSGPVPITEPDFELTDEDEKIIEEYVRQNVHTAWHSLGTCAMKPRESDGVVDERLNVYGTDRLKVVDMSICPGNVAANTYSTAVVIGEKAAVLIAEELGIPLHL